MDITKQRNWALLSDIAASIQKGLAWWIIRVAFLFRCGESRRNVKDRKSRKVVFSLSKRVKCVQRWLCKKHGQFVRLDAKALIEYAERGNKTSRGTPCSFYLFLVKNGRAAADRRVPRALEDLRC